MFSGGEISAFFHHVFPANHHELTIRKPRSARRLFVKTPVKQAFHHALKNL
jgi:hypothetical protein